MRKTTLTALPLAALILVTALSGCSEAGNAPTSDAPSAAAGESEDYATIRDAAIATVTATMSCPDEPLALDGEVVHIEGDCGSIELDLDGGLVIVDRVDTLTVSGTGNAVFADTINSLVVDGTGNSVMWATGETHIEDTGSGNDLQQG